MKPRLLSFRRWRKGLSGWHPNWATALNRDLSLCQMIQGSLFCLWKQTMQWKAGSCTFLIPGLYQKVTRTKILVPCSGKLSGRQKLTSPFLTNVTNILWESEKTCMKPWKRNSNGLQSHCLDGTWVSFPLVCSLNQSIVLK